VRSELVLQTQRKGTSGRAHYWQSSAAQFALALTRDPPSDPPVQLDAPVPQEALPVRERVPATGGAESLSLAKDNKLPRSARPC